MVANVQPIFLKTPQITCVTFVPADATTPKTIFDAGADGSKIFSINVTSDDTATVNMQVFLHNGTTNFLIGTVAIPTLSGTNGVTPAIDLLSAAGIPSVDIDGELFLPDAYTVRVAPKVTVTTAKTVTIVGIGANY